MTALMWYLGGTLLRGLLVFAGAVLMERFGTRLLVRGGRLIYYYLLLAILVCPIPGVDYGMFAAPSPSPPEVFRAADVPAIKANARPSPAAAVNGESAAVSAPVIEMQVQPEPAAAVQTGGSPFAGIQFTPLAVLFSLWLVGACIFALKKLVVSIGWVRRIGRLKPVTDARVVRIFRELQGGSTGREIRLLDSDALDFGPCCFGLVRPCVLFPASLAGTVSDDQLKMLLAHELEHIRRRDMLQISFRELLKIPLFFNPFLWYVLKRLNCATELACDAAVVRVLHLEPESQHSYGKLLLNLASTPHAGALVTAPGIRSGARDLKLRLREVVSGNCFSWKRVAVLLGCSAVTGGICMLAPSCVSGAAPKHSVVEGEFFLIHNVEQISFEIVDGTSREVKKLVPTKVHFQYLTCIDSEGRILPSADNMVFYSPWLGEKVPFKDKDNRYYAEELGWTVFAIPDMGYTDARMILAGQDELTRMLNLKPRKLLMYGASSGATNSINASILYPDRFDAIAAHSSRRWYPEKKGFRRKDTVTRLLTNNWYDGAGNEALAILDDLRKIGMDGLHIDTPPNFKSITSPFFHRGPHYFTQSLFHQYFKDIVKLRDANGGIVPPMHKWPVKIKKADGRIICLPGKNLEAVYRSLPNDLVGAAAEDKPLFFPAVSGKADGVALLLADPGFKNPMKLLDTLYYLASAGNVDVYALEATDPRKMYQPAVDCLNSIKGGRPVYVVGTGSAGGVAVSAAANSKNPEIRKVTTVGTARSLVAEIAKKPELAVVMYYDAVTASNESGGSIVGVNIDAPAGFGAKITGILEQSVKPDEIQPVASTKQPAVNRMPQLAAAAKTLQEKVDPAKPETARAFIDARKKLCAEAEKMQKSGVIDITEMYKLQADLGEAELKYAALLNTGKTEAELNGIKIDILKKLIAVCGKHGNLLYTRFNAGQPIDREDEMKLRNRQFEFEQILSELQRPQVQDNKMEQLKAEVEAAKIALDEEKPETVRNYINALNARYTAVAGRPNYRLDGVIELYQWREELEEARLKYIAVLNPGKTEAELKTIKIGILEKLASSYGAHGKMLKLKLKVNAGQAVEGKESEDVSKRHAEITGMLEALRAL